MRPVAALHEQRLPAEHLLRPVAHVQHVDELDEDVRPERRDRRGQRRPDRGAAAVERRAEGCRQAEQDVVARVRIERVVQPIGARAERVDLEEEALVERLQQRHGRAEAESRRPTSTANLTAQRRANAARGLRTRRLRRGGPRIATEHAPSVAYRPERALLAVVDRRDRHPADG